MEHRSSSVPDPNEIAELRARADAGDQDAAGRLGELLARSGDREGALRVWARAYGDSSPTTKRLAELRAEDGDLEGAVSAWQVSDAVWQNREGLRQEYLDSLDADERLEDDDPEDWAFIEEEQLTRMLAERGDEAAIAKLRAQAHAGDSAAATLLATCEERYRRRKNATTRSESPLGE
ncbi:hypothetical protein ABZ860_32700 [Microbispora sp. NPDC046973]|uniref:hypothetical protein n=1 Tax=Microbispora sp. NPDC046973 TaxID=3155022 RepID=UPI0033F52ABE